VRRRNTKQFSKYILEYVTLFKKAQQEVAQVYKQNNINLFTNIFSQKINGRSLLLLLF
jgi:hypothetical protein